MTHVLVVGGGVAGLLTVQALLDRADDLGNDHPTAAAAPGGSASARSASARSASARSASAVGLSVTVLVHRPGDDTASRSGGLSLRYASTDPRSDAWTARSSVIAAVLADRHPHLRPFIGTTAALLVSRRASVAGYRGHVVDPSTWGLPYEHGLLHDTGPLWDPCGLLPRWPTALAAHPGVRLLELPERVSSLDDLTVLHDLYGAGTTVACLGLGAHVLGDTRLGGRLGVLVRGPLPVGTVHAERAVIDDDDPRWPRYTVPHRSSGPGGSGRDGHLHVGGTYLPVDDPADWDDPARLRERAHAELPALLADAGERFPALAGWRPDRGPWWGIRPVRDTVALGRVAEDLVGGRDVVVSHGWGGSGWTIGPAVVEEVARSLLPGPRTGPPGVVGLPDGAGDEVTGPPGAHEAADPLAAYGPWRP